MDKSIIIWNSKQLAEKIIVLTEKTDGHDQSIKGIVLYDHWLLVLIIKNYKSGLSWDPYGRFLV